MVCYSLFSGSSGNAIYLKRNGTEILVDAGGSIRQIAAALASCGTSIEKISAVFVTHEHVDHTRGIGMLAKRFRLPVFCQTAVAKELYYDALRKDRKDEADALARTIRTVEPGEEYEWGDFVLTPFATPHDSVASEGFLIGDREIGIATDLGCVTAEVRRALTGCRSVILESNYDREMLLGGIYPPHLKARVSSDHGHLDNADCAAFLPKAS